MKCSCIQTMPTGPFKNALQLSNRSAFNTDLVWRTWRERSRTNGPPPSHTPCWEIRVVLTREHSADCSPFIRNHSSKKPLSDMTGHGRDDWPFWCGFLILDPSDIPDRSLTSWIQWLHITSPRLSQVTSPWPSLVTFSHLHSKPGSNMLFTN